ncbi:hypothetical protein OMCYN_01657 [cyanobiont of Ornithocercus magnificus]|nr:hypothetical protein OMCYN_01657 [cyanobiont of Ornithocercus magnificus]
MCFTRPRPPALPQFIPPQILAPIPPPLPPPPPLSPIQPLKLQKRKRVRYGGARDRLSGRKNRDAAALLTPLRVPGHNPGGLNIPR